MESEFIALSEVTNEIIWVRKLLKELGCILDEATTVYEDNQACIQLAKNPANFERAKHIDLRYYFVKDAVADGIIRLHYVKTKQQQADLLTKPIHKTNHKELITRMGMIAKDIHGNGGALE
jgi:hypothetical protein